MSAQGTILVTGTNGGLGSQIVASILKNPDFAGPYHGIYTVRKASSATQLRAVLRNAPATHHHETLELDLGKLAQVRATAAQINARVAAGELPRIRALVLNAGFQEHFTQDFSEDGYAMCFQANYLSHWLLTLLLLESMDREHGRIVVVGSWSHDPADKRNEMSPGLFAEEKWKTLFHDTESLAKGTFSSVQEDPTFWGGFRRYASCKLCEVMMIHALQPRLDKDPQLSNISILGVDPGGMGTGLMHRGNWYYRVFIPLVLPWLARIAEYFQPDGALRTPARSAGDLLRAAFDTKTLGEHPKGVYLDGRNPLETSPESRDPAKLAMLWEDSVRYTALKPGETALAEWR